MSYERLPIVGAFYRPPAKTLIEALAIGTPLTLMAEPENQFDSNAIAVWLFSADIPESAHATLEANLPASGHSLTQILGESAWHLGYIPKDFAAQLKDAGVITNENQLLVTFATDAKGAPRVKFDSPVL